jgi:hypothetical protein
MFGGVSFLLLLFGLQIFFCVAKEQHRKNLRCCSSLEEEKHVFLGNWPFFFFPKEQQTKGERVVVLLRFFDFENGPSGI